MVRDILQKHIISALEKLNFPKDGIVLDHPAIESHGDYSANIALRLKSDKHKNPREIASKIVNELQKDEELKKVVSKIDIAGPGFINFWLRTEWLTTSMIYIIEVRDKYGKSEQGKGKKVLIEFGQPNTHKLPHIGHFRSYSLGESLARIQEFLGNTVYRANYQGDIGLHVAKCLWGWKKLGLKEQNDLSENIKLLQKAYEYGSSEYEASKKTQEEINELNLSLYHKDPSITDLWEKTRGWSLSYYDKLNKRLGTTYHKQYFETQTAEEGKRIVLENIGKVFEKSEGAIIFPGEKYDLHTRVFITEHGNPTYEAKDLGLIFLKSKDFDYEYSLIATASEQTEYFKVVYKAASLIAPDLASKFKHIAFGMVTLKGGKLSSRTGNIISIDQLLEVVDEALVKLMDEKKYTQEQINAIREPLTIGASKYAILKNDASKNITFDLNVTVALDGNSGPYLQYTYARCKSVLSKENNISYEFKITNYEFKDKELNLLRTLYKFPEVVLEAGKNFSPNLIANYLYDLAQKYNLFYQKVPILNSEENEKQFRLALTAATAQVLKNGLTLLGIPVLEKM